MKKGILEMVMTSKVNVSGRPKNSKVKKFGPEPKSMVISQILYELNKKHEMKISAQPYHISEVSVVENSSKSLDEGKDSRKGSKVKRSELYSCDFSGCNYSSKLSSNLKKHMRTHTEERPYLCDQCSFRTNFVNSLKTHKRLHTDEKPYVCEYCPYRCNSSSNLKKHCKHKHTETHLEC